MITVTVYQSAAIRSKSKRQKFTIPYHQGVTVLDILRMEFEEKYIKSVIVMVNDDHEPRDVVLNDGDNVSIMSVMGGG